MATRGQSYASIYLQSRLQSLDNAVAYANNLMGTEQDKYAAEQKAYRDNISSMDQQILEYDKLLADARKAQSELSAPRTGRVTRSAQRETLQADRLANAVKVVSGTKADIDDAAIASVSPDPKMAERIAAAADNARNKNETGSLALNDIQQLVNGFSAEIESQINEPHKRAATRMALAGVILQAGPEGFTEQQAIATAFRGAGEETIAAASPESIKEKMDSVRKSRDYARAEEVGKSVEEALSRGAYYGGGQVTSVTREEALPGEAARMALIRSEGFKKTANALRDDGVISAEERKALLDQKINPDDYLDNDLMQAIARTGTLTSERTSLVGRRAAAQEGLASLIAPDASIQRQKELTSMFYGREGIAPQESFFKPKKTQQKIKDRVEDMTARQAMFSGFMKAASGKATQIDEADNVYASQLSRAIESGNEEAVNQSFENMRQAGFDATRLTDSFAVAAQRAREMESTRKAQEIQKTVE